MSCPGFTGDILESILENILEDIIEEIKREVIINIELCLDDMRFKREVFHGNGGYHLNCGFGVLTGC